MAPEQLRGEPAAIGCDVWGWGSLVYEALIGRAPFARGDAAGVIHAILHEKPPYPSSLEVRVPQALRELVDRALDKRPEQRFASLEEALPALERIQGDAESTRITLPWRPVRPGPSIAVLAFADMSVDGDYEHFCDGISEEIISDLSRVEGLRVISRTSSFSFKDKSADVREIGQQLGVGTVLEGSVRVSGDRLRVTAQLIDTSDGAHLWVERYDRALANVFDIQEDIARRIVGALSVRLSPAEDEALAITRTRNVRAYDYYLRGRRFFYRTSKENIARAVGMYERAAAEDPAFALAHAGLSFCHAYLFTYFDPDPLQRQEAVETAQRALILAPDLAEAHAAYGLALSLVPDFQQADREFRSAVELDPHLFEGYYFHARACTVQGRHAEAAELFGRAHDVRPEEYQALCLRGFELRTIGELEASRKTYEIVFQNVVRHLRLVPDDARAIYMGAEALLELGQRERAMRWARRVERLAAADPYNVYGLACFYARQGDVEQGLAFLERAVGLGFTYKEWIEADSDLDPLHEHPGYQSLVAGLSG
jgi:TolB-like protein/Flp pilus assembly protein TadD